MTFAPEAYRAERVKATEAVESALKATDNLRSSINIRDTDEFDVRELRLITDAVFRLAV